MTYAEQGCTIHNTSLFFLNFTCKEIKFSDSTVMFSIATYEGYLFILQRVTLNKSIMLLTGCFLQAYMGEKKMLMSQRKDSKTVGDRSHVSMDS